MSRDSQPGQVRVKAGVGVVYCSRTPYTHGARATAMTTSKASSLSHVTFFAPRLSLLFGKGRPVSVGVSAQRRKRPRGPDPNSGNSIQGCAKSEGSVYVDGRGSPAVEAGSKHERSCEQARSYRCGYLCTSRCLILWSSG